VLRYRLRAGRTVIGRSDRCDVALPSDGLIRTHCVIDEDGGWWLTDRSRHGTFIDGRRVEGRVKLAMGASFTLGDYAVRLRDDAPTASATMTRLATPADFEELVEVADEALARRAVLHILDGERAGSAHELSKAVVWLGGREADVLLSHDLPIDACRLRVVRGRVIAEPGSRPVYLDGGRLREPTPVWENETLRVGGVTVELRSAIAPSKRRSLDSFGDLVGRSPPMVKLFAVLDRISRHHAPVLLLGESGTGKELAARATRARLPLRRSVRGDQLRVDPRDVGRQPPVRAREGRVHRGRPAAGRRVPAGARGDAVLGRARRDDAGHPGAAAARARVRRGVAAGRIRARAPGRAGGGGDQPRPWTDGRWRKVSF
jgi:hypothetical protein